MRKTKRVFWGFLPLDYKAIETYLEEMAEKGWMLEKVGAWAAKFRAIEPQKLKFYIDVFKEGGPLAPENTKEAEEYRNLCLESGWSFITSRDYLQFFYAEGDDNLTSIQTDEVLEQKIVESTLWRGQLISVIICTIFAIKAMSLYFPPRYKFLLSFVGVAGMLLFPLLFISVILPAAYDLIRTLRARRNINRGLPIEKPTLEGARKRMMALHGPTFVIGVIIALAIITDSFFRPQVVAMSLAGPIIGMVIGLILRYIIKRKATDKKDSVLYVTFAILGVLFFSAIANPLLSGIGVGSSYKRDIIPEGYPAITMSDLLEGSQQGTSVYSEFNAGMSPIIPKHYSYLETWDVNGTNENIRVKYYKTIHPRFAEIIFNGITAELREGIKWKDMILFRKTIISDDEMKNLWNVNNLALTEARDEIIIQKGNIVVHLSGNIDFENRHVRELIIDNFLSLVETNIGEI